jgi:hypothetical protein
MSEFKDAISWRGPDRPSFIIYGLWRVNTPVESIERASVRLKNVVQYSEVLVSVATDEGWPCSVGVFDVEFHDWPSAPEGVCRQLLGGVCQEGPELAWMMFDGMLNALEDIFCQEWAAHIYAVQGDCGAGRVDLAIDDEIRRSPEWEQLIATHRERLRTLFPSLRGTS